MRKYMHISLYRPLKVLLNLNKGCKVKGMGLQWLFDVCSQQGLAKLYMLAGGNNCKNV